MGINSIIGRLPLNITKAQSARNEICVRHSDNYSGSINIAFLLYKIS